MQGKVVIVTGASSGVGAAVAVRMASLGCRLALTARNEAGLEETRKSCLESGSKPEDVLLIIADFDVHADLEKIVKETVKYFERIDVLVNNAGYTEISKFGETTESDYDRTMNVNLRSVFFLTQFALPHLVSSKGCVVSISSAIRPFLMLIPHFMSKAALDHFTRSVALCLAKDGVRVNSVNPGMVNTPNVEKLGLSADVMKQLREKFHAMGRAATVDEIAKAVVFLADEEQSSFITGETLVVDGGFCLLGPSVQD